MSFFHLCTQPSYQFLKQLQSKQYINIENKLTFIDFAPLF